MNWPLVSRSTLEAVTDERNRLREQVDRLLDHVTRMERVEAGVPELPPQPRKQIPPIPAELMAMIQEFDSPSYRLDLEKRAQRRYSKDGTWDNVIREMREIVEAE